MGKKAGQNNKYIVYDKDTMKPLSGMSGQTKTQVNIITKDLKRTGIRKQSIWR